MTRREKICWVLLGLSFLCILLAVAGIAFAEGFNPRSVTLKLGENKVVTFGPYAENVRLNIYIPSQLESYNVVITVSPERIRENSTENVTITFKSVRENTPSDEYIVYVDAYDDLNARIDSLTVRLKVPENEVLLIKNLESKLDNLANLLNTISLELENHARILVTLENAPKPIYENLRPAIENLKAEIQLLKATHRENSDNSWTAAIENLQAYYNGQIAQLKIDHEEQIDEVREEAKTNAITYAAIAGIGAFLAGYFSQRFVPKPSAESKPKPPKKPPKEPAPTEPQTSW